VQNQIVPENDLVFIGICGERFDLPDFEASKDTILARSASHITQVHTARGHRVDRNRDKIVQAFYASDKKPDWLLFLDSDMTFPDDIVYRLLSHRKPVVGGLYFHRATNVPFVFMDGGIKTDEWGRKVATHTYCRDEVFDYLELAGVENKDQAVAVDGPEGRLLKCDAVATGAMLIHRSVLDAIKAPWFEYVGGAESEDLSFCRRVREAGFEIHADLGTICGHLSMSAKGYSQFRAVYASRGIAATNYTFDDAADMLERFTGEINPREALAEYTPRELAGHWLAARIQDDFRDIDFYKSAIAGETYTKELLHWNATPVFAQFRRILIGQEKKKVLEIGSGIGTVSIQLAAQRCDVDAYEANAKLRLFAKKRFNYLKENDRIFGECGDIKWHGAFRRGAIMPATPGIYDLVVALDVLEHMDENDLRGVIGYVSMYLKPGGRLFFHNAWGDNTTEKVHPFHYDHSDIWNEILAGNDLFQVSPMWAIKRDLGD